MFPETLLTLISTLEKSCCRAEAAGATAIAATAKIMAARIIVGMSPPSAWSARDCSTADAKCEPKKGTLAPGRQRAAAEERFGGPLAEINRERDAVAVVSGEDD